MVPKKNLFEERLDEMGHRIPEDVREAITFINDTLELSWLAVKEIFGDKAIPEHAMQLYDRINQRIKDEEISNSIND